MLHAESVRWFSGSYHVGYVYLGLEIELLPEWANDDLIKQQVNALYEL
jgi:hypothetical protein